MAPKYIKLLLVFTVYGVDLPIFFFNDFNEHPFDINILLFQRYHFY